MSTIAESLPNIVSYEEKGGVCSHDGCDEDAPRALLLGSVVQLLCSKHAEEERRANEAEEVARRAARYMTRAGATPRLSPFTLASYRRDCGDPEGLAALKVAEGWLASFYGSRYERADGSVRYRHSTNLLFYGEVGSGKTGLAWGMVRDLCEHGIEARHVTFRKLLNEMKDAYAQRVAVEKYLRSVIRAPVLCLDDLGSEVPTKWAREQLLGIVDERYERCLPTIYVSNYDPDDLSERLSHDDPIVGGRIVSRMTDGAVQHRFKSADRRQPV